MCWVREVGLARHMGLCEVNGAPQVGSPGGSCDVMASWIIMVLWGSWIIMVLWGDFGFTSSFISRGQIGFAFSMVRGLYFANVHSGRDLLRFHGWSGWSRRHGSAYDHGGHHTSWGSWDLGVARSHMYRIHMYRKILCRHPFLHRYNISLHFHIIKKLKKKKPKNQKNKTLE